MAIYKDKNNKWYVKCYYTDFTGQKRQKMKRGFTLQRDAKEWERDFLARYSGQPTITFKQLYDSYLQDRKKAVKASTFKVMVHRRTRLLPYFGEMKIADITPLHINEWQLQLKDEISPITKKPLTVSHMRNLKAQLSSVFNYATKYYKLASNPCRATDNIFGKKEKHVDFWTTSEFNQFVGTFDKSSEFYTGFNVLYYTGIRIGEMLALTIKDVDLKKKTITINKTLSLWGKDTVTPPKTQRSNRVITIPSMLCDIIKNHINRIYDTQPDARLFNFHYWVYLREMKEHIAAAGVKPIRIHDLRHSHASLLIELGFSALVVSERLGHENVTTTLNIYAHMFPNKQSEVADRLDALNK